MLLFLCENYYLLINLFHSQNHFVIQLCTNRTKTKFIQAQSIVHLIQKGKGIFNTGCFFIIHITQIKAQSVVYQNKIQNLIYKSFEWKIKGKTKNQTNQIMKPTNFQAPILLARGESNNFIIIWLKNNNFIIYVFKKN